MNEAAPPLDNTEQGAMDGVLTTTRELVEAVLVVEHRLAAIASLSERFGTRYLARATVELEEAANRLAMGEHRRRSAVARAATFLPPPAVTTLDELVGVAPEPLRTFLADSRAELAVAQERIRLLRERAEDILGRRVTLIVEALSAPGDMANVTYGRSYRARPRHVSARL